MIPRMFATGWQRQAGFDTIQERLEEAFLVLFGEPIVVPRDAAIDKLETYRLEMQYATNALMEESKQALETGR